MRPIDRPELFLIPHSTFEALSMEEVEASYADMEELGIASLPYLKTDMAVAGNCIDQISKGTELPLEENYALEDVSQKPFRKEVYNELKRIGVDLKDWELRLRFEDEQLKDVLFKKVNGQYHSTAFRLTPKSNPPAAHSIYTLSLQYRKALIVLLATKNVIKTRRENKALRLGIGAKNIWKPLYTTTITLPPQSTITESTGEPGKPKRPHLRRGHIRNQRYGPKLAFTRRTWIKPCFINADEDFISSRTAYNTSLANHLSVVNAPEHITTST